MPKSVECDPERATIPEGATKITVGVTAYLVDYPVWRFIPSVQYRHRGRGRLSCGGQLVGLLGLSEDPSCEVDVTGRGSFPATMDTGDLVELVSDSVESDIVHALRQIRYHRQPVEHYRTFDRWEDL